MQGKFGTAKILTQVGRHPTVIGGAEHKQPSSRPSKCTSKKITNVITVLEEVRNENVWKNVAMLFEILYSQRVEGYDAEKY